MAEFQQTLTDPTTPRADTRNLNPSRAPVSNSTAQDVAIGVTALAGLAERAIPIFMQIQKKDKIEDFNSQLVSILSDSNASASERNTRVKNLYLSSARDNPDFLQDYNTSLVNAGVKNPVTTEMNAAAAADQAAIMAGSRLKPDGTIDEQREAGRDHIQQVDKAALIAQDLKNKVGQRTRNKAAIGRALETYTHSQIELLGGAGLAALGTGVASGAETLKDKQAILAERSSVVAMIETLKANVNGQVSHLGISDASREGSDNIIKRLEAAYLGDTGIFSDDGPLSLSTYSKWEKVLASVENTRLYQRAEFTNLMRKALGAQTMASLVTTAALTKTKGGTINSFLDSIASEIQNIGNPEITPETRMSARQMISFLRDHNYVDKLKTDSNFRAEKIARMNINYMTDIAIASPEEPVGIKAFGNAASNLLITGTMYLTEPKNIYTTATSVNTSGHKVMMGKLDKVDPEAAKAIGNRTVEMGGKTLTTALKEIKSESAVDYINGKLVIDQGKYLSRTRGIAKQGARSNLETLKERVIAANTGLQLYVDNKKYVDNIKGLSDIKVRDNAMFLAQKMSGTDFTRGAKLKVDIINPEEFHGIPQKRTTVSEETREQLQVFKGQVQKGTTTQTEAIQRRIYLRKALSAPKEAPF